MPDNILEFKSAMEEALNQLDTLQTYEIASSTTPSLYLIMPNQCTYHDTTLNMAVCYSYKLEKIKRVTIEKRVLKESKSLNKDLKKLAKRSFACLTDAHIEVDQLTKQIMKKVKYHSVTFQVNEEIIKRPGRPSKTAEANTTRTEYKIHFNIKKEIKKRRLSPNVIKLRKILYYHI